MSTAIRTLAAVVLGLTMVAYAAGQTSTCVLVTLDETKIGPNVPCDGTLRISTGKLTIAGHLLEEKDSIEGAQFRLRTSHTPASAKAAKLPMLRGSTLAKGLIVDVEGPADAVLAAETKLGNFTAPLERIKQQGRLPVLEGKFILQVIPTAAPLGSPQAEEEYPSIAVLPDGRRAVAFVSWSGKNDQVMVRLGQETKIITPQPGDYLDPRCAVDGAGKLWLVWTANDGRQWDLWAWCDGRTQRLTTSPGNDFWPRLAADRRGRLWVVWQTVADDQHYEVQLARLDAQGLAGTVNVSQHAADDWEPAIVATTDDRLVVAWDTYRNGSYDIYLREFAVQGDGTVRPSGEPRAVAATPQREAHATLAADGRGRVWIAWDTGNADWGKHPQRATLHSLRTSHVACWADGKFQRPAAELMDSLPQAWRQFVEYPHVAVDGQDRLWVVSRIENRVAVVYRSANAKGTAQSYGLWLLVASCYDGQKWSEPLLLARSNGRQDMRVDVARDTQGELHVAYGADGRTRAFPYVPVDYDVFAASLAGFAPGKQELKLAVAADLGRVEPASVDLELAPLPRAWKVGGKEYRLVLGDTHRHTDISRCNNGQDGSLQDAYRYALNACQLDWLAISDHDQDILKHRNDHNLRPRQDYDWWRSQKYCDLYTIPGRFVALYGYEHGGSYQARGGHKNVVHAQRGQPVEEVDAPHELFAALANASCVVIPHQLADAGSRAGWERWDGKYERVAEIFQTRGSYEFEGCPRAANIFTAGSMWDALANGVRIGIIASSDHGQTHQARAGAYVEQFTRDGILEALRARRTFGATTAVRVQVQMGAHLQGEEFTSPDAAKIDAQLVAPAAIKRVDVVRDGKFVYTAQPGKPEVAFTFTDVGLPAGQTAYYYVRAQIGASDWAWSSPIWVTRK